MFSCIGKLREAENGVENCMGHEKINMLINGEIQKQLELRGETWAGSVHLQIVNCIHLVIENMGARLTS